MVWGEYGIGNKYSCFMYMLIKYTLGNQYLLHTQ